MASDHCLLPFRYKAGGMARCQLPVLNEETFKCLHGSLDVEFVRLHSWGVQGETHGTIILV